jgi:Mg-chelatase subunit ChlD
MTSTAPNFRFKPLSLPVFLLLFLVSGTTLQAQPRFTVRNSVVNGPKVEVFYRLTCDGMPVYDATLQQFRITENGVPMVPSDLWCPDPNVRCAVSVALVFDASGSMTGSGNLGSKQAGHAFVDLLDGKVDEAAVLWFNSVVTLMQSMTRDRTLLHSAVDVLPATGSTAAWDGAYGGLIELINNATNPCRAVILLTDGGDASSTRTPEEVVALAHRHRIRIFTIGLGSAINSESLEFIADATGGRYYQTPNAGQLAAIYMEISTIIFQGFQECSISYTSPCMDGAHRTIEVQVSDVCGTSLSETTTFKASMDSSTFSMLYMALEHSIRGAGMEIRVPLRLLAPADVVMFYPMQLSIVFDTAVVELYNVTASDTTLLAGVPVSWTSLADGATIRTTTPKLLTQGGTLLDLHFRTKIVPDTACTEVKTVAATFEQGCFIPVIADGRVCIAPGTPIVHCDISAPSSLDWEKGNPDYSPNPFTVLAHFSNRGDSDAKQARYTITFDTADVRLYFPGTDTKPGSTGIIAASSFENVNWPLTAIPRIEGDTTRMCITARFDNHPDVVCCTKLYIPRMEPILDCRLSATEVAADSANVRYTPMPFPVTLEATNLGPSRTDSVWATIDVPMELDLAEPDAPDSYRKLLSPPTLGTHETAKVTWQLRHPRSNTDRAYTVSVLISTANSDSKHCAVAVRIPGLPIATFPFTLTALGSTLFCEGDSVLLDAGAGYATYRWSNGARDRLLTVKRGGNYYCNVEHSDGRVGISDTVRVTAIDAPSPRIAVHGSLPMCENDSVQLDAGGGYTSYLWSNGAPEQIITVHSAGAFYATVRSSHDCEGYSDTVIVTTKTVPSKPGIRRNLDWLIAQGDIGGFYWYRDGVLLPDSGYSVIKIKNTGRYQLRVRFMNGCSALSDPFDVTVLETDEVPQVAARPVLSVWPEPATDILRIELADAGNQSVTVALYDMLGRPEMIHSGVLPDGDASFTHTLHGRLPGVYYLVALLGESVLVKRVSKL